MSIDKLKFLTMAAVVIMVVVLVVNIGDDKFLGLVMNL